jgi:hypothetical protein
VQWHHERAPRPTRTIRAPSPDCSTPWRSKNLILTRRGYHRAAKMLEPCLSQNGYGLNYTPLLRCWWLLSKWFSNIGLSQNGRYLCQMNVTRAHSSHELWCPIRKAAEADRMTFKKISQSACSQRKNASPYNHHHPFWFEQNARTCFPTGGGGALRNLPLTLALVN